MKIVHQHNSSPGIYFTSDTHYHHKNICRATTSWEDPLTSTRDFKSLEHMDTTIVDRINNYVMPNDTLFHLGDWSFGGFDRIAEFRNRLVCQNVHLILGNHDQHIEADRDGVQGLFTSVQHYLELDIEYFGAAYNLVRKCKFVLMHYPIQSWNNMHKEAIHLHGHVHLPNSRKMGVGKMLDVGIDGNNYFPYNFKEILNIMDTQPVASSVVNDHHLDN